MALLLLALGGMLVARRRADRSGSGGEGAAGLLPEALQQSAPADSNAGASESNRTAAPVARPAGSPAPAPAAESAAADEPGVPATVEVARAEPLQEPDAIGEAAVPGDGSSGHASYHDASYTIELPTWQATQEPGGEDAGSRHALADKLAAAKALRAGGHAAEAASQAHEILKMCDAFETELQALTQRIQPEPPREFGTDRATEDFGVR